MWDLTTCADNKYTIFSRIADRNKKGFKHCTVVVILHIAFHAKAWQSVVIHCDCSNLILFSQINCCESHEICCVLLHCYNVVLTLGHFPMQYSRYTSIIKLVHEFLTYKVGNRNCPFLTTVSGQFRFPTLYNFLRNGCSIMAVVLKFFCQNIP